MQKKLANKIFIVLHWFEKNTVVKNNCIKEDSNKHVMKKEENLYHWVVVGHCHPHRNF